MLLKNNAARLVTINGEFKEGKRLKAYQIKPGNNPSVEVPNALCDNKFVKALVADGTLLVVSDVDAIAPTVEAEVETSSYDEMNKADLIALAESVGIEVLSKDTKVDIVEKLVEHDAA